MTQKVLWSLYHYVSIDIVREINVSNCIVSFKTSKTRLVDPYVKRPSFFFAGFLYDDATSDFSTFAEGNDNFNRRLYEYFLRPRAASKTYVISPTSIALGLAVLAIG